MGLDMLALVCNHCPMTKRHFIAIARILRLRDGYNASTIEYDQGYNDAIANIAGDLAVYFGEENPRFDVAKFLDAALLDGAK